jgi:hypothetical protein
VPFFTGVNGRADSRVMTLWTMIPGGVPAAAGSPVAFDNAGSGPIYNYPIYMHLNTKRQAGAPDRLITKERDIQMDGS